MKTYIDYESLFQEMKKKGYMTFTEIQNFCKTEKIFVAQIIDILSIRYPVWNPKRGIYKVITKEDYEMFKENKENE